MTVEFWFLQIFKFYLCIVFVNTYVLLRIAFEISPLLLSCVSWGTELRLSGLKQAISLAWILIL